MDDQKQLKDCTANVIVRVVRSGFDLEISAGNSSVRTCPIFSSAAAP